MKKQKSIDRVHQLLEENTRLRKQVKAGESRRRAAVDEVIFLNHRLSQMTVEASRILSVHQATMIQVAQKFGTKMDDGSWEITYPEADLGSLFKNTILARNNADGSITVQVVEDAEDGEDGRNQ